MILSQNELIVFFEEQRKIFDIVRLVDVSLTTEYSLADDGSFVASEYQCYTVWNKRQRCENCISAKAYAIKGKLSKFEFVNDEIYFVLSVYSKIDGTEFMIEMVTKLNDDTLYGTYGKSNFIQSIEGYNKKLYLDGLTGAYNRHYYNEQLRRLYHYNCVAMLDVDDFKSVNDTYGHAVGDFVLKEVVKVISSNIRAADAVIRLGGDEFLFIIQNISKDIFTKKLDSIMLGISSISNTEHPDLKVSASIGAICSNEPNVNLMDLADKALYEAKKIRNKIILREH